MRSASEARPRLAKLVSGLVVVNVLVAGAGFVTGPLLAQALGPDGRGNLAAIIVPLTLTPQIMVLSLNLYAGRQAARKVNVGLIADTIGGVLVVIGLAISALALPLADYLAQGRDTVRAFLIVGFALTPIGLVALLLESLLVNLERWRAYIVARVLMPGLQLTGVIALYLAGELTVATAAGLTMCAWLLTMAPLSAALRGAGRLRFSLSFVREGIAFGARAWLGGIAQLANARFDQLLMIRLVDARELGLYAVAVTVSMAPSFFTGALAPPLYARVAGGQRELIARAMRVTLLAAIGSGLAVAAVTPLLLPLLFGDGFRDAIAMALVLLLAAIPLAGAAVLSSALTADGAPGVPSIAEAIALCITVPGLLLVLPWLGGLGAAIVSGVAYLANFSVQLAVARRRFGGRLRDYLVPKPEDVRFAIALLRSRGAA